MADNFKLVQAKKFQLSGSISLADTSITVKLFTDPNGTNLTMTDFGAIGYGTLEPSTSKMEIISFTGITQNGNGTATLTGVTRGLKFVEPYDQDLTLRKSHAGNAVFILTNNPQVYAQFPAKNNDETIENEWIFTLLPRSSGGNATDGDQLVTYDQAVAMATGTTSINRVVVAGNGGGTITAGNLVYLNTGDGEWYRADADTAAQVDNIILGIAQGAGSNGVAITNGVLLFGLDSNQSGLTAHAAYYASNTAGGISSTPGTTEVSVGIARSTTSLLFYPRYNQQLTESQQDALDNALGGALTGANPVISSGDTAENTASKLVRRKSDSNITVPTTPTATTDATSKAYVDGASGGTDTTSYVLGESFTGATTPQPCYIIDDLNQFGKIGGGTSASAGDSNNNRFGTNAEEQIALKIIPRANVTIAQATLELAKVGTPTDNISIEIQTDNAGSPSGTPVTNGTSGTVAGGTLSASAFQETTLTFSTPPSLTANTTYWVVLKRSSSLSDANYFLNPTFDNSYKYGSFDGKLLNDAVWSTGRLPSLKLEPATGSSFSIWLTDSDSTHWYPRQFFGWCTTTGSAGDAATLVKSGILGGFTSLKVGVDYYTSPTAGSYTSSGGGVFVGRAVSSTQLEVPRVKYGDGIIANSVPSNVYNSGTFGARTKLPFNGIFTVYHDYISGGGISAYIDTVYNTRTLFSLVGTPSGTPDTVLTIPYTRGHYISFSGSGSAYYVRFTPIIE